MQEEQYEHAKFKLSHWILLHVFKESKRFATHLRQDFSQNSLKALEIWTLTFIELIMLPVKKNKTQQLTAMFNKKKMFTGQDEKKKKKMYFNNL